MGKEELQGVHPHEDECFIGEAGVPSRQVVAVTRRSPPSTPRGVREEIGMRRMSDRHRVFILMLAAVMRVNHQTRGVDVRRVCGVMSA